MLKGNYYDNHLIAWLVFLSKNANIPYYGSFISHFILKSCPHAGKLPFLKCKDLLLFLSFMMINGIFHIYLFSSK